MKKFLFMAVLAASSLSVNAQDILVRRGGDVENVKVLEVTPTEVKYKKFNNQEGPTFTERRSNLISVKYENGEVQKFSDSAAGISAGGGGSDYAYYEGYGKEKKFVNELSFYIGDGWGLGWQLRKVFNPYIAWNIIGVSYMSGFHSPEESGVVNFKLLGARGYTPSWKWIRGYADLNLGYTLGYYKVYKSTGTSHNFGLDFSVGIQLHKRFAIGYNLNFTAPDQAKTHMARLSLLF